VDQELVLLGGSWRPLLRPALRALIDAGAVSTGSVPAGRDETPRQANRVARGSTMLNGPVACTAVWDWA